MGWLTIPAPLVLNSTTVPVVLFTLADAVKTARLPAVNGCAFTIKQLRVIIIVSKGIFAAK